MKANEAPEKIYIVNDDLNVNREWYKAKQVGFDTTEYTRTATFIEKACEFFEENIEEEDCKIGSSEWTELRAEYKSLDSFIRAFVKYMNGE